ncbi:MAG: TerB family tellurite resistance protein [Gammaproteobacteria bacterium]|nr:TerB family tellurite resistance protein [Gammaproteobacteria bacterium]
MIEEPKDPRIEDDELIIETLDTTESYNGNYLVAALLVFVARGDGNISDAETAAMIDLVKAHRRLSSSETLALLTRVTEDIASNPDFNSLLKDLAPLLSVAEKEEAALMMLKVAAADGRRDTEEIAKVRIAAELIDIPPDILHRAYDRYFEETQV